MLGLWVFMRNAAPVIGGAIIFGLNHAIDSSGGVSLQTYLVIIGIMCAGPFISLLLSRPEQVQRKDGVKIELRKTGWKQTFHEWYTVVCYRDVRRRLCLVLAPLFPNLLIMIVDSFVVPTVFHVLVLWLLHWSVFFSISRWHAHVSCDDRYTSNAVLQRPYSFPHCLRHSIW